MNGKTLKRLIITYPFPLGGANGGARMTREIARHLALAGCEVIVLAVSATPKSNGYPRRTAAEENLGYQFDKELTAAGVKIQRLKPNRYSRWLDCREIKKAVRAIIAKQPVDAVLSYYHEGGSLPRLLRRHNILFGYICTWQSYHHALDTSRDGWRSPLLRIANRLTVVSPMRQGAVLFATSAFTRDELIDEVKVNPGRVVICYLGVDKRFFSVHREPRRNARRILFFGRLVLHKGVEDALYACSRLATNGIADWEFHLFGYGDQNWVREVAVAMGIENRVFVHEPLQDEDLLLELAKADVAILPSHFEAFGLAFAEAQAAGLAVISYRAGSVPEVVQEGLGGWLAPLRDRDRLGSHLAAALGDPAELYRRGMAGREWVQNRFSWPVTARTIMSGLSEQMIRENA